MPEGHTIHRAARRHTRLFGGQRVSVTSPQGKFLGADVVDGATFVRGDAYGKHLFHHYDNGGIVHVHLGLFGKFFEREHPAGPPLETQRMRIVGADATLDLSGATACELVTPDEVEQIFARLGPDPIRRGDDGERGWKNLQRRSIEVGRSLMDQKVLSGVGNVYRAEVLFVHGIHPEVPSKEITREQWDGMWASLTDWMRRDVRSGRITTTDPDEIGRTRSRMKRDDRVHVYKQDRCRRCGTEIRRWDLAGRWAYACETCQPPSGPPR